MSCQRAMLLAVERAYPQSLDAAQRLIRLQLAHVGVRVQVHIGRTDHRGAIARTEPRGRAELPHFRPHDARIEGQRDQGGIAPLPVARPVLVRSQLEERLRARIDRVQLLATNRPSAVGHPSLQHHRPSDREVLLDQPGDRWGPRSPCENGSVQRVHVILARHERAVPQSDLAHRLRSDQGKEIRLRQRQQVDCGVGAGPTRASGQACQRTGGTHTEEPATVHAHVRNTSVLTYRNPESMMIVPTVAPAPSRLATCSAATMLAPLEVPAKMASSRARRRAISFASSEATMKISFTSSRLQSGGMNPIPMPSIWCEPDGLPESTADSAGSTPATCNRGL